MPSIGAAIQDGIDSMQHVIDRFLAAGITVLPPQEDLSASRHGETSGPIKTVCISGRLPSGRKNADYGEPLRAAGYALVDDVMQGLIFLVLAEPDSSSSKVEKARRLPSGTTAKEAKPVIAAAAGPTADKSLCISGKLPIGRKKADYEVPLLAVGITLVDEVVKGLTYLVVADPASTSAKAEKAQKLGVVVMSEEAIMALVAPAD